MKKETSIVKNLLEIVAVLAISFLAASAIATLFPPAWETNDDFSMGNLAAGVFGESTEYLVFVHHFVGKLLQALYNSYPGTSWIGVVWELTVLFSFAAALWALKEKGGWIKGTLLWLAFTVMFGYSFYVEVNFTRVAAIAAGAGYLLLTWAASEKRWVGAGFGILLCWMGYMIRGMSWWMVTALAGGLGLAELLAGHDWKQKFFGLRELFKSKRHYFLMFGAMFLGVLLLELASIDYMVDSPQNQYYEQFNSLRGAVVDYPADDKSKIEDELSDIGISPWAYEVFTKQMGYYDPNYLGLETIQEMYSVQRSQKTDDTQSSKGALQTFNGESFRQTLELLVENRTFGNALICLLLALVLPKKRRWFLILWQVGMLLGLNWYLAFGGRNPERVMESICTVAALYLLWAASDRKSKRPVLICCAILVWSVLLVGIQNRELYFLFVGNKEYQASLDYEDFVEGLETEADLQALGEKNYYYLTDICCNNYLMLYLGFEGLNTLPAESMSRFIYTGGWLINHPVYLQQLENAGIQDLYHDLFTHDKLFLMDQYRTGDTFQYLENLYSEEMNRSNWSICTRIGWYGYLIGFADDSLNVEAPQENAIALDIWEMYPAEEDLVWLSGTWEQDFGDGGYYLRLFDENGNTECFKILPEYKNGAVEFQVGIPVEDYHWNKVQAQILFRQEGKLKVIAQRL